MMHPVILLLLFSALSHGSEESLKKLAVANNDLAIKLYNSMSAASTENLFFSPLSISSALGMLFYGAKGSTAEELRNALGYKRAKLSDNLVHTSFKDFLANLVPSHKSEYTLNIANAILLDKKLDPVSSYKKDVQDYYKAFVQDVDFAQDGEKIADEVNSWVKKNTNGKINDILDDLDASSAFLILNAVYFKGNWENPFDPRATIDEMFYNGGLESNAVKVQMMHSTSKFSYAAWNDMHILELPYKGKDISMLVLLPNKSDGISNLEKELTLEELSQIQKMLSEQKVTVTLPKFKLLYSQELSSDFQALGAKSIFEPGVANFSGIAKNKRVAVSQIYHKAVVEVNEVGSEAAAVTGLIVPYDDNDDEPTFTADHPFLFAIVDKRSDMILFLGRVNNL